MKFRIHYNSPLVLNFALLCAGINIFNSIVDGWLNSYLALKPGLSIQSFIHFPSLITYPLAHAGYAHLLGNMSLLLLIGPILEEKYGAKQLLFMMFATTIITAIFHLTFFSQGLIGASGIVFMFITLVSITNAKGGQIPLTFILVFLLYIGQEIINSLEKDNVSQFAHILGGICGSFFGLKKIFSS